jgi:hypothetical protein
MHTTAVVPYLIWHSCVEYLLYFFKIELGNRKMIKLFFWPPAIIQNAQQ